MAAGMITTTFTSLDLIATGVDDGIATQTQAGGGGGHPITGTAGDDTLEGTSADDTFIGGAGNDSIDGGDGIDRAQYSGFKADYSISRTDSGAILITDRVAGRDGTDTLVNIERLQFADGTTEFDASGHGGEAYRLYQAAFDRAPDTAGLGYWVGRLDDGASLRDVADAFLHSQEFEDKFGGPDAHTYVTQLYQNVLHREGDSGGEQYWEHNLSTGALTRAEALMLFSESPENQANLVGTISAGISY